MVGRVAGVTTLAELLPIGVLLLDSTGRVIFANDTVCGMLNQQPLDLKHGGFEALINPEDRGIVTEILGRLSATPGVEECTVRFLSARIERGECRFCSEGGTDVTCIAVTIEDVLQARLDRGDPTMVAFLDLDEADTRCVPASSLREGSGGDRAGQTEVLTFR